MHAKGHEAPTDQASPDQDAAGEHAKRRLPIGQRMLVRDGPEIHPAVPIGNAVVTDHSCRFYTGSLGSATENAERT